MSHSSRPWLLVLSFSAVLLAVGCAQEEGELCDTDDNCAEGLECHCGRVRDGVTVRRGICMRTEDVDESACPELPRDSGPPPEGGMPEAGVPEGGVPEAGVEEDGGAMDAGSDAGAAMDAGSDAGPPDAGSDAGSPDAGSPDTGVADAA